MATTSFDIFDTVLTRRVGNPRSAFLLLGQRLRDRGVIDISAESFARARTAAEVRAFKNAGGLDSTVDLMQILTELTRSVGLNPSLLSDLHAHELELELELLVPVDAGVELLSAARKRNDDIVFTSDMYLPSCFLRSQLIRHGLFEEGDRIFVSNELGRSKATGKIWPEIVSRIGTMPGNIVHVGNDIRSDVREAKKAGIAAELLDDGNANRYEQALERFTFDTDGLTSVLAGAARLARLNTPTETAHGAAVRDVSAGVVAPFLIGNVLWILRRAKEEGVRHIHFIARDGQLLLDIAVELASTVGYDGKLSYLYGSRQAWSLPSVLQIDDQVLESIVPGTGDVDELTVRLLARRFNLEPEDFRPALESAGFPERSWDAPLDATGADRLRQLVASDRTVQGMILSRAKESRALMLEYLDDAGVITDEPIAIVDQGTGCTLFNSLSRVLSTVGQRPPRAFYFGVRSGLSDAGFGFPEAYVRDELAGTGFLSTPGLLTLVEMVCTADHGSVTGYRRSGEVVAPMLACDDNAAVSDWGLATVHSTVVRVARELAPMVRPGMLAADLRPAALAAFEDFWGRPTAMEAAAWSSYPFEDGWGSDAVSLPLAGRQGIRAVWQPQPHRHWWKAGARALSRPVPRTLLRTREDAVALVAKARCKLRD